MFSIFQSDTIESTWRGLLFNQYPNSKVVTPPDTAVFDPVSIDYYCHGECFCDHKTAGKADVMGIYNILFMVEKGLIPKEMTNKVINFCVFQSYRNYFRCSSPTLLAFSEHSGFLTIMLNL